MVFANVATATPLQTIGTFCGLYPDQCKKGTESLLAVRGTGTNAYYVLEADPTTGAIPTAPSSTPAPSPNGRAYADSVRYTYVTAPVTTAAWVQMIASTAAVINCLFIFDSSGQTLMLGTGAALSETIKLIITPGGLDGCVPLAIPAGTRVSLKALSATTGAIGEFDLTGLN